MSEQSQKSRFAIDLDDLERQLRGSPAHDVRQPQADPLAELAKLVGTDDPYREMFRNGPPSAAPVSAPSVSGQPHRVEPVFGSHAAPPMAEAPPHAMPEEDLRGALDEFDAIFDRPAQDGGAGASAAPQDHAAQGHYVDPYMHAVGHADLGNAASHLPEFHEAVSYPEETANRTSVAELDDMISRDLERVIDENRHADTVNMFPAAAMLAGAALPAGGSGHAPLSPMPPQDDMPYAGEGMPPARRGLGRGAMTAAVLVAIGIGGVGAAALWRGTGKTSGGEPPTIKADATPSKVQPQNPGGAEFPDQNKRIYERGSASPPSDTKVVNREEQPVDVQAAARSAARAATGGSVTPGTATPDTTAAAGPASALGEPRKVRTVLIRPDGTIAGPAGTASAAAAPALPATAAAAAADPRPATTAAVPSIVRQQATRPATAPKPAEGAPATAAAAAPAAAQVAPRPPAPVKVAAAPAADAPPAASGTYSVQLGAPGSEDEARSTFASLQRRYPDELGGQRPLIRKADISGREVFRLRVGSLSSGEATELCNKLKARGGQCFIARN